MVTPTREKLLLNDRGWVGSITKFRATAWWGGGAVLAAERAAVHQCSVMLCVCVNICHSAFSWKNQQDTPCVLMCILFPH